MKVRVKENYHGLKKGTVGYSSLVEQRMVTNTVDHFCVFRGEDESGECYHLGVPRRILEILGENDSPMEDAIDKKEIVQDTIARTRRVEKLSNPDIKAHVLLQNPFSIAGYVGIDANHDPLYYIEQFRTLSSLEMSDVANVYLNETRTEHIVISQQFVSYKVSVKHKAANSLFDAIDGVLYSSLDMAVEKIFKYCQKG